MKKICLTLLASVALLGVAQAQNVSLGLKVGGSLANQIGEGAIAKDYRVGFLVGGFANLSLSDLIAFQPELLYTQKGGEIATSPKTTFKANYLDVPLPLHVNADGLFFEAGPQVGFLVAAKSETGSFSTDVKDLLNGVDFGYLVGLGYQLKTGPGVGLRYNGAFTNIVQSVTSGNTTIQQKTRNSAFQLYVSYSFNERGGRRRR